MRFALNTKHDDRFIPIVMALRANGYLNFQYENVIRLLEGIPFGEWGTGWKTKDLRYQRRLYEKDGLIYKLWDKTFLWKDNIVEAIRVGYYGPLLTPGLLGVIVDDDAEVRGYVMYKCQQLNHRNDFTRMLELLEEQRKVYGMTFNDPLKQNVGTYKGRITLFDLENVSYEVSI
jgi:hypothetical protein